MYDPYKMLSTRSDFVLRLKTELYRVATPNQRDVTPAMVFYRDGDLLAHAVLACSTDQVHHAIDSLVLGLKPEAFEFYLDAWTSTEVRDPVTGLNWGAPGSHSLPELAAGHDGVAKGWVTPCLTTTVITAKAAVNSIRCYTEAPDRVLYGAEAIRRCHCRSRELSDDHHREDYLARLRRLLLTAQHSPRSPLEAQMDAVAARAAPAHRRDVRDALFARMVMLGFPGVKVGFLTTDTEAGHARTDVMAAMIRMGDSGMDVMFLDPADCVDLSDHAPHHDHRNRGGLN